MITIFAVIVCGGLLVVGVVCLIVSFSASNHKKVERLKGEETMAMVKRSNGKTDLITLPNGVALEVPNEFNPHLVMDHLARIQNSPNLVSAYVDCLIASVHPRKIKD